MKFLIKKYLQFERQYGTTSDINRAKERITQYVNANDDIPSKSSIEQQGEEDDELDI
jgi:hypothetical protein